MLTMAEDIPREDIPVEAITADTITEDTITEDTITAEAIGVVVFGLGARGGAGVLTITLIITPITLTIRNHPMLCSSNHKYMNSNRQQKSSIIGISVRMPRPTIRMSSNVPAVG